MTVERTLSVIAIYIRWSIYTKTFLRCRGRRRSRTARARARASASGEGPREWLKGGSGTVITSGMWGHGSWVIAVGKYFTIPVPVPITIAIPVPVGI